MEFFKKLFGFPAQTHPRESPPPPFEDNFTKFFGFEEDSISRHFQQQIESFFDKEMEDILKSFGMPSPFGQPKLALEPPEPQTTPDSRDYYLKPNYQNDKIDADVDGKLSVNDLDQFLKNPNQKIAPQKMFFNQSVSVKTIRTPDGSFETHRTVTDSDGNQETTVTKKQGEKEYTIIKKRDRDGKEEVHENMINMTEDEKFLFGDKKNDSSDFYDKFFK